MADSTPNKVVNKDYLYNQFKIFYEQVSRPDIEKLEAELVKINVKLNAIIDALSENGITVDVDTSDSDTTS